jgi:hypothetical protein
MKQRSVAVHDLVLIHISDQPASYARVEAIEPDVKRGWYQVKLLILTVPLQVVVWILERDQIDGAPYTMGGTPVRLERVVVPAEQQDVDGEPGKPGTRGGGAENVIALGDRLKRGGD